MAESDEQAQEKSSAGENTSSGQGSLITILVLLNTLMMGAIGYFQFQSFEKMKEAPNIHDVIKAEMKKIGDGEESIEETGQAVADDGILFPLDGFTANLAQGDGARRFIRLNLVLKFSKDSNEEEFKRRKAQIRDSIINILNSKRPEDLLNVEGKNFLKEEIKAKINSFLVDGSVIDTFLVSYQIN